MSWACDPVLTSSIVDSYQVMGPQFVQTLQTFFAAQCAIAGDHLWPDDITEDTIRGTNYDFIVVGAGSAGSVVANRLSEVPQWKVLLVEAGGNPSLQTEMPQLFYNNLQTSVDWNYRSQPQDGACRAYGKKGCAWPRGKVLGGSSSINGMYYVRANKADYDLWAASGNYGWSYKDVLPYFLKSERFSGEVNGENIKYHNPDGYLFVNGAKQVHPLEQVIIQAGVELGMKNLSDINGPNQMGILASHTNVKDNVRFSTARAFLSPIRDRQNLHVIKNAYVTKLLFAPGTDIVSGVVINKNGKDLEVHSKKEVIVSAGSINSPQLLSLSGIGPKKHLEDLGIKVVADLPVGENLQDHVFAPIFYTKPDPKDYSSISNIFGAFLQYVLEGAGPFKDTEPHRVISFMNTTDPASSTPDIQHHYLILPPGVSSLIDVFDKHSFNDEAHTKFLQLNENKFTIIVANVVLLPKSVGKILLASKDPSDKPLIYANYFDDPEDMASIIRSMKQYTLKLGETKAFKEAGFKLDWLEMDSCKKFETASDEHLDCLAREITFSLYHPTSTIKMGPDNDKEAVVDPELKVRKVKNLRVIDASIMPFVVRGNTNAATIMIGEKGADMIKNDWLNRHVEL